MTQKSFLKKRREALYNKIIDECVCYSIGTASEKEIDKINILQATFLAMKRAVDGLEIKPDLALVDGNRVPPLNTDVETIVKGRRKICIHCSSFNYRKGSKGQIYA